MSMLAPISPSIHLPQKEQQMFIAKQFESMFLGQMFKMMFESLPKDSLFGGGSSEEIYQSMLTDSYAEQVSQQGSIGISEQIYAELIKLQEV